MPKYHVFQQLKPTSVVENGVRENMAVLNHVCIVEAGTGRDALNQARAMPVFKQASRKTLAHWPIVEEV